jgi:general secretion pathway protein I
MKQAVEGFSLLEILVAFTIMGIALGIALNIFSTGVTTALLAEDYTIATQIAESLMASAGVEEPLIMGEKQGIEDERYRWQVTVQDGSVLIPEQTQNALLEVRVTVEWGESEQPRYIELKTVKTGETR